MSGPEAGGQAGRLLDALKPDRIRAILRSILFHNPGTKLLSLALAIGIWVWVQEEQVVEDAAWVRVEYRWPEGLVLADAAPRRIRLSVSGARGAIRRLKGQKLMLLLDSSEGSAGVQTIDFVGREIHGLPPGVKVLGMVPSSIQVQLERKVSRRVRVEAATVGHPADGFRVSAIDIQPSEVDVEGPARALRELDSLPTEAVDLRGLRASKDFEVGVSTRGPGLRRVDDQPVHVRVTVEPVTGTRVFDDVQVVVPRAFRAAGKVLVELEGPVEELDAIEPADVLVRVELPADAGKQRIDVSADPDAAAHYHVVHPGSSEVAVKRVEPARIALEPAG